MNEKYMRKAMSLAKKASEQGEIPVGCVIVKDDVVISSAQNMREQKKDATCHAEIIAIKKANKKLNDWRLDGCELYVTLEPCPMCAGAIVNSRIKSVYFGAFDKVSGSAESVFPILKDKHSYHEVEYVGGIMEKECAEMLKSFFKNRRKENKERKK